MYRPIKDAFYVGYHSFTPTQFTDNPQLDLSQIALDEQNAASGGPLANALQWCVFFGEIKGFKRCHVRKFENHLALDALSLGISSHHNCLTSGFPKQPLANDHIWPDVGFRGVDSEPWNLLGRRKLEFAYGHFGPSCGYLQVTGIR